VEKTGRLGGTCFELAKITPFHNSRGEQVVRGLPQERIERIIERGGACQGGHLPNLAGIGGSFTPVDPDVMKLVLFEMAADSGVSLWLHSLLVDTIVDGNTVKGIRIYNKSGFQELSATTIVEATGDGDVAAAGAAYVQDSGA
jgi:hypothetical protein